MTYMTDRTRPPWANLPHGDEISALLDALRDLTGAEVEALDATPTIIRGTARVAAWFAAMGAGRTATWTAAWTAGRGVAWFAEYPAARSATQDAALALVAADLVGQYGLTRYHLNTLAAPARTIPRLSSIIDAVLAPKEN